MNTPRIQIQERVAFIQRLIAEGRSIKEAVDTYKITGYHIREFMKRNGVSIPAQWAARKHTRQAKWTPPGQPFLADQRLPANGLTDDELDSAYRFGIHPERMAWLLSCKSEGNAYGLTVTR
jgi:hypothetical protein